MTLEKPLQTGDVDLMLVLILILIFKSLVEFIPGSFLSSFSNH